jgi:hypothetical protein
VRGRILEYRAIRELNVATNVVRNMDKRHRFRFINVRRWRLEPLDKHGIAVGHEGHPRELDA